jgi:hypothetical protein
MFSAIRKKRLDRYKKNVALFFYSTYIERGQFTKSFKEDYRYFLIDKEFSPEEALKRSLEFIKEKKQKESYLTKVKELIPNYHKLYQQRIDQYREGPYSSITNVPRF